MSGVALIPSLHGGGVRLVVQGQWNASCAEVARVSEFNVLELHRGVEEDLRFLQPMARKVRNLWINCELKSLDGLDTLFGLEGLTVSSTLPAGLDLSVLPQLQRVNFNVWDPKIAATLFKQTRIRQLRIEGFTEPDCTSIALLSGLEELCLAKGRLQSLAGIAGCRRLRSIELSNLRELSDVSEVKKLPELDALTLGENLPKLKSVDDVFGCSGLSELTLIGAPKQVADTSWVRAFGRATVLRLQCGVEKIDLHELLSSSLLRQVVVVSTSPREIGDSEVAEAAKAAGLPAPKITKFGSKKRPAYMFDFAT